jgi:hypothetical protein
MRDLAIVLFCSFLSGCCTLAKRSCFPVCDDRPIVIQSTCKLPPMMILDPVSRSKDKCPDEFVCYDMKNARMIADRESRMKAWIKEAVSACGVSSPASRHVK